MPLFSVIIPTFNRRALLEKTLLSVRSQPFEDMEIIVVDDGSTDGTMEFMQSLEGACTVLSQPNRGPGAARNLALEHASGEYAAFLDSDDLWFPWSLQTYTQVIREQDRPSFIAGHACRFRDEAGLSGVRAQAPACRAFPDYFASGDQWRWYGLSSFVVRRELVMQVGGLASTPINGEDADLALRLGDAPGFVQVTSPATYAYREHAGGIRHQLEKTLQGQLHQLKEEESGRYPGGRARARERWRLMGPHMRSCSIACLKDGLRAGAWTIYRRTLRWHLALGRWKYLAGFPILAITSRIGLGGGGAAAQG